MADKNLEVIENQRRGRKPKKKKRGRMALLVVLLLALLGTSIFLVFKFFPMKPEEPDCCVNPVVVEPTRQYTTFQTAVNEEYKEQAPIFTGAEEEIDLVARYFGTNLFTMWGMESISDYNGQDLIAPDYLETFNKSAQNNLFFRFKDIVATYGAENLPIVTDVTVDYYDITYQDVNYKGTWYSGYSAILYMSYQDGTIEGTQNENYEKTNQLLAQWVHRAEVVFFFVPDEETDSGQWYVSAMYKLQTVGDAQSTTNVT